MGYTWEGRPAVVAQIFNLLYRRFSIGRASPRPARVNSPVVCGLQTRDTAQRGAAATKVAQIFNLLYRGFVIRSLPNFAGPRPVERSAECNSAIQQSATLRYEFGGGHPAGKIVAACNDSGGY